MSEYQSEDAAAQYLTAQGFRAMTSETWSCQVALDALREQRRRYGTDARFEAIEKLASVLADRLTQYTDVSLNDSVAVLLVASASVGALAITHQLPAVMLTEIIQATAVELDERANGGEGS
ncbi:hypothetical protein OG352_05625 [Streptomyces sp. NBC_01485]|uniref:hypothetical protein n=1 Tax=Streptomyces sp. NBC_01485 TaxID=2903884 RepID=UPI002E33A90C|nr:hypothetical protein [Streptomyces sp. NBC_01485]